MASARIAGTFATGAAALAGQISDVCVVPTGRTQMLLTITGADGSNQIKSQKRTSPDGAWTDQTTYSSNQSGTAVTVASGEQWRLVSINLQALREIRYSLDAG